MVVESIDRRPEFQVVRKERNAKDHLEPEMSNFLTWRTPWAVLSIFVIAPLTGFFCL
jgi:hypothetical protein